VLDLVYVGVAVDKVEYPVDGFGCELTVALGPAHQAYEGSLRAFDERRDPEDLMLVGGSLVALVDLGAGRSVGKLLEHRVSVDSTRIEHVQDDLAVA
jgi:hypothetical protein